MLTLPIKKKWFDMILSGEKKEEYRSLTPYYAQRFRTIGLLDDHGPTGKESCIILRNGYGRDCDEVAVLVTLRMRTGRPEWGAEPDMPYFVLEIKEMYIEREEGSE